MSAVLDIAEKPYSRSRTCSIKGCDRKHFGQGLCQMHHARQRRHGDPLMKHGPRATAEERFWAKVNKDGPVPVHRPELGPCWVWTGSRINNSGYGNFYVGDEVFVLAHRHSYELLVGPIPAGLTIDHLCRNRPCTNPEHLEPVTGIENTRRATEANRRTHCPSGHEFTPENTYSSPSRGDRRCRECERIRSRARRVT